MKTNYLKIIATAAAVLFAIGGSFVSHASEKKAQTFVAGYATINFAYPCEVYAPCNNLPFKPICTVQVGSTVYQAFGKSSFSYCPITLWRN